jgi:hypothetical protein
MAANAIAMVTTPRRATRACRPRPSYHMTLHGNRECGLNTPMSVILIGVIRAAANKAVIVIGGTIAHGIIGCFSARSSCRWHGR